MGPNLRPPVPGLRLSRRLSAFAALALVVGFVAGALLTPSPGVSAPTRVPIFLGQAAPEPAALPALAPDAAPAEAEASEDTATVPEDSSAEDAVAASDAASDDAGTDDTSTDAAAGEDTPAKDDTDETPQDLSGLVPNAGAAGVKHLWVITVTGAPPFADAARTAGSQVAKGALLEGYAPPSAAPGSGEVVLLAGQPPNAALEQGCPTYGSLQPRTRDAGGVAGGTGCLYPRAVKTLADLVVAKGGTARSYVGGQGAAPCRHPAIESPNPWVTPGADGFSLVRSPFVLFASTVLGKECSERVVDLGRLAADLAGETPTLSWITPDAAQDGRDPAALDLSLRGLLAQIQKSPAYADGGLIAIVPDSAPPGPTGALLIGEDVKAVKVPAALDGFGLSALLSDLLGVDRLGKAADTASKLGVGDVLG